MAELLFIKTSSLGDVIHHLPAVTDVRRRLPDARLAWVVEEDYAPLARLHPGVDEVIAVATRRWRKRLTERATWGEISDFRAALRARRFAAAIDTQGLLRTALITAGARGVRHGYDRVSIREPLACPFYDVRHRVERRAHAIARNRALCGLALGYDATGDAPDYGLDRAAIAGPAAAGAPYGVIVHGTAQARKLWPEPHWLTVTRGVRDRGLEVVLPWGSAAEFTRSTALAAALGGGSRVPDRRPLDEVAAMLAGAAFAIGVDTGLVHVAAALGVPLVAIFVDTEPGLTGPVGQGPIAVVGGRGTAVSPAEVLAALDGVMAGR